MTIKPYWAREVTSVLITRYKQLSFLIFFMVTVLIGYLITYVGISIDEPVNRRNGAISANYVIALINRILGIQLFAHDQELAKFPQDLMSYADRDYGVAVDLPLFLIERLFNINESSHQYLFRHFFVFGIFTLGACFLYKLLNKRFDHPLYGIIGVVFLYTSPRILGEAFYNIKDIVFMSMFCIATYFTVRFLNKPTYLSAIFCSILTALAIDVRVIGLALTIATVGITVVKGLRAQLSFKRLLLILVTYLGTLIIAITAAWPWLWVSPAGHFIEAMQNMSKFRWDGSILFKGIYYPAAEIPRTYLITWIGITTPILYLGLAACGIQRLLLQALKNKILIWKNSSDLTDFIMLMLFLSPLTLVFFSRPIIYDGWRQFYFLYPALIYLAVSTMHWLLTKKPCYRIIQYSLVCVFALQIGFSAHWMISNFPFWNVYFNTLVKENWFRDYEKDYWGLSTRSALEYILCHDADDVINIYGHGQTTINESMLLLSAKDRTRIKAVRSIEASKYIIFNYRVFQPYEREQFEELIQKHGPYKQFSVDDKPIMTILKTRSE